MQGTRRETILGKIFVNVPFSMLSESYLSRFITMRVNPEIGIDAAALDRYPLKEYLRVANSLKGEGLKVNLHAPFMDLAPGSPDSSILALTRARFERMVELGTTFEAKGVIFHAGYDRKRYGFMKESWVTTAVETWLPLAKVFRKTGAILLLENVYEHSPEELLGLFEALKSEEVGFCLDTGHQAAFSRSPLVRWVQVLGPFVRQLHLHDNRGEDDEHLALGQGSIDFRSLFRILESTLREPPGLTLEPHKENDLWPSIEYLEKSWSWEA